MAEQGHTGVNVWSRVAVWGVSSFLGSQVFVALRFVPCRRKIAGFAQDSQAKGSHLPRDESEDSQ